MDWLDQVSRYAEVPTDLVLISRSHLMLIISQAHEAGFNEYELGDIRFTIRGQQGAINHVDINLTLPRR